MYLMSAGRSQESMKNMTFVKPILVWCVITVHELLIYYIIPVYSGACFVEEIFCAKNTRFLVLQCLKLNFDSTRHSCE